ncbi:Flotillin-like protein 3 [Linum perenne]
MYKVAKASELLAITGVGITDIKLAKKKWILPIGQSCTRFDISPVNYTFEGIIEGETRVLAASMTMEEIFRGTKEFKKEVFGKVQLELNQFGLIIYNANVKQLVDVPGSPPSPELFRRSAVEIPSEPPVEEASSPIVALAAERTYRKDPLDSFKRYNGGWNISERHYWASVGFTAAPLFLVGLIWFLGFGICLLLGCLCHFCCKKKIHGYSRIAYAISLICLVLFSIAAIIGCIVLYNGQGKFHRSTTQTLERLALIVVAAIMLVLTFLGLLFSIFGMQSIVYILVVLGWILVAGTFILCGIFLLLHNVAGDACVAMDQWVQNPAAHTALDEILPCVDTATAQETLSKSKEVTSQLAEVVNQVITNMSNINFSPNFKPLYINQSGPLVPILCNPFHADLTDRPCSPGEVDLNNATQAWSSYVCQVSPSGTCITTGRLTPTIYSQMVAAINVSFGLINYAPFLVSLEDCSFARQTFSDINRQHCPGLRRYSREVYIGLVIVSTAVMLSLIFWIIYGRERRHRAGARSSSKPQHQHQHQGDESAAHHEMEVIAENKEHA